MSRQSSTKGSSSSSSLGVTTLSAVAAARRALAMTLDSDDDDIKPPPSTTAPAVVAKPSSSSSSSSSNSNSKKENSRNTPEKQRSRARSNSLKSNESTENNCSSSKSKSNSNSKSSKEGIGGSTAATGGGGITSVASPGIKSSTNKMVNSSDRAGKFSESEGCGGSSSSSSGAATVTTLPKNIPTAPFANIFKTDLPASLFLPLNGQRHPCYSIRPGSSYLDVILAIKGEISSKNIAISSSRPSDSVVDCIFALSFMSDGDLCSYCSRLIQNKIDAFQRDEDWLPIGSSFIVLVKNIVSSDFSLKFLSSFAAITMGPNVVEHSPSDKMDAGIISILKSNPHLVYRHMEASHDNISDDEFDDKDLYTFPAALNQLDNLFEMVSVGLRRLKTRYTNGGKDDSNAGLLLSAHLNNILVVLLVLSVDPLVLDIPSYFPLMKLVIEVIQCRDDLFGKDPLINVKASYFRGYRALWQACTDAAKILGSYSVCAVASMHKIGSFSVTFLVVSLMLLSPMSMSTEIEEDLMSKDQFLSSISNMYAAIIVSVTKELGSYFDLIASINKYGEDNSNRRVGSKVKLEEGKAESKGETMSNSCPGVNINSNSGNSSNDNNSSGSGALLRMSATLSKAAVVIQLHKEVRRCERLRDSSGKSLQQEETDNNMDILGDTEANVAEDLIETLEKLGVLIKKRRGIDSADNYILYQECLEQISVLCSDCQFAQGQSSVFNLMKI